MRCRLLDELDPVEYRDNKGRQKLVRYWLMAVDQDPGFVPNDEVDELRWVQPEEATELLTYPHDAELVRGL